MATKSLKTRIQNKHDTEANWAKATTFKPLAGELIIYDKDSNNAKPRLKIGDGITTVTSLPFVAIDYDGRITSLESTVNGLGTAAQKDVGFFATAAQGTKADNAVPNTRKVNNKVLSTDIKLEPSDVGVTESAFPGLKKTGTITGIKMNGASKGTSGVVDLGTVLTSSDNLAKLDTENTFTAKQTINSGYGAVSLKTQGYVEIGASFASKSDIGGLFGYKDDGTGRIYAIMPRDLGFVECIKMNNSSIEPDDTGIVDLGTVLTSHQSIKTLNTNNTTSQTASASEALSGSGTINLHKVAKTGNYNDLSNRPTIPTVNNGTLTIKQNGTTVQIFSANQSGNVIADITFHLYEHNIYLSCSNTTSTVAPSRAYIYFTIITTDSRALNWTRLNNILRKAERNAGGYGYIGDPEGNNKSFNASVQKIQSFNTNSINVTMVYNNSLIGIDNTYDSVTFYSSYVTITDTVRTIL